MEEITAIFHLFFCRFCDIMARIERSLVMKRFLSLVVFSLITCSAFAANNGRPAMSNKIMSTSRYTASVNQLNEMASANGVVNEQDSVNTVTTSAEELARQREIDAREAERNACINNNIGIGNTFVWASRFSNSSNYAMMVEDTVNPANNVCFVRVEVKSDDESRVSVSDVKPKYFMWGENIECGSWVDEDEMEKRILAAKKGSRVGGIVAGAVVGAGVGVGAMELFGNKLIGGKVQGQKAKNMEGYKLYRSVLLTYKDKNPGEYEKIVKALTTIKEACEKSDQKPVECDEYSELIAEFAR